MSNSINIGIAGLGTIGCGVVNNLLRNQESLKEKYGLDFEIIGVSASNKTKKDQLILKILIGMVILLILLKIRILIL